MTNEKSLKESFLAATPFLAKVLELVLAISSLSLIVLPYNNKLYSSINRAGFIYSAYSGAIFINILIIISHFMGQRIPKKPCLITSCFYGILLLLSGFVVIQDWKNIPSSIKPQKQYKNMLIASGVCSFCTGFVFFTDIVLSVKYT